MRCLPISKVIFSLRTTPAVGMSHMSLIAMRLEFSSERFKAVCQPTALLIHVLLSFLSVLL